MEKFNNLSKGKKAGVIAGVLALLIVLGVGIGTLMGGKTKGVVLSKDNLANLVETEYTVETLNQSKDGKELEVNIKGDLQKKDLEHLAKALNEKNKASGWNKEEITVNIFGSASETVDKTDFFVDGLLYTVVLNAEKSNADLSEYVSVPAVEKTDTLVEYSKGNLTAKDGNLVLSLDMDLSKNSENLTDVVQQAKTFAILFRETNKDKEIKSIELKLNPNDNEKKYNFHTEFENVLEVIDVLPL